MVDGSSEIVSRVFTYVHACVVKFIVYESRARFDNRLVLSMHDTECVMSAVRLVLVLAGEVAVL